MIKELTKEEFDRINLQDNFQYGEFNLDILSVSFDTIKLENMGFELPFQTYSIDENKKEINHSIIKCPKK